MNCVCCGSAAVTERSEVTAGGYRRFRCRACGRQFNERSGGVLNRTCLPSGVIAFLVFCRLRYRLTLRDPSEIMALRGIEVSYEAVQDWEAKLLPVVGDALRKRRFGKRPCIRSKLVCRQDLPEGPRPLGLPLPGRRPGREPDRRDAERAPRHEGGQGLLPLGAGDHGLPAEPGDDVAAQPASAVIDGDGRSVQVVGTDQTNEPVPQVLALQQREHRNHEDDTQGCQRRQHRAEILLGNA